MPRLGLDTAQGLELLSLLGTLLALGALLLRQLRHLLIYLLLWAAYLSVCQASGLLVPSCVPGTPITKSFQALHPPPCPVSALPASVDMPLLSAGGPGVSLFPVVSDYWVWGHRRQGGVGWGGCACLPRRALCGEQQC